MLHRGFRLNRSYSRVINTYSDRSSRKKWKQAAWIFNRFVLFEKYIILIDASQRLPIEQILFEGNKHVFRSQFSKEVKTSCLDIQSIRFRILDFSVCFDRWWSSRSVDPSISTDIKHWSWCAHLSSLSHLSISEFGFSRLPSLAISASFGSLSGWHRSRWCGDDSSGE